MDKPRTVILFSGYILKNAVYNEVGKWKIYLRENR